MDAWQRDVHAAVGRGLSATGAGVGLFGPGADCCGALAEHAGLRRALAKTGDKVGLTLEGLGQPEVLARMSELQHIMNSLCQAVEDHATREDMILDSLKKGLKKGGGGIVADELVELIDTAIYKEVASQSWYLAGMKAAGDPGAKALMGELATQEAGHADRLKALRERGTGRLRARAPEVADLRLSEYLLGAYTLEGAGLEDTLIFAIGREQESMVFYSQMMGVLVSRPAKRLAAALAREELSHKLKLEILFDDLFYREG
jgi:rubrerythrin